MLKVVIFGLFFWGVTCCSSKTSSYVPAPSKAILKTEVAPIFPNPRSESELNAYRVTFLPTFEIHRRLYVHRFTEGKWDSLVGVLDPGARNIEDIHAEAGPPYEYRVTDLPAKETFPLQVITISLDRGVIIPEDTVREVSSLPPKSISRLLLQKNARLLTLGLPRDLEVRELIAELGSSIEIGPLEDEPRVKTGPFRLFCERGRGELIVKPRFEVNELRMSFYYPPDIGYGTQEMEFVVGNSRQLKFKYSISPAFEPKPVIVDRFATYSRRCLFNLNHEKWIIVGLDPMRRLAEVTGFYLPAGNDESNEGIYVPASGKGLVKIIFQSNAKVWTVRLLGLPSTSLGEARSVGPQELRFPKMYPGGASEVPLVPDDQIFSASFRRMNPDSKFTLGQARRLVWLHCEMGQLNEKLAGANLTVEFLLPEQGYSGPMELTKEHQTLLDSWVSNPNRLIKLLKEKKANRLEIRIADDRQSHPGSVQWVLSEAIPAEFL